MGLISSLQIKIMGQAFREPNVVKTLLRPIYKPPSHLILSTSSSRAKPFLLAISRHRIKFIWTLSDMVAMAYASSSFAISSTTHKPSSSNNSQIFGCRTARPLSSNGRMVAVKCSNNDLSVVPLEQRWMFEQSEVNGPDIWNATYYPKAVDHINTDKPWYIVDATDKILGRLASTIAIYIRGKNLATYTPSLDMGAFVIVVNADKIAVSGKKRSQKLYRRHSGRPGGMKVETFAQLQQRIPERIIEHAVEGMLPRGRLGRRLFHHLKVYKGPDHPHEAQQPIQLPLRDKRIQKEV